MRATEQVLRGTAFGQLKQCSHQMAAQPAAAALATAAQFVQCPPVHHLRVVLQAKDAALRVLNRHNGALRDKANAMGQCLQGKPKLAATAAVGQQQQQQ